VDEWQNQARGARSFGAKNNVNNDLAQGLGHRNVYGRLNKVVRESYEARFGVQVRLAGHRTPNISKAKRICSVDAKASFIPPRATPGFIARNTNQALKARFHNV